MVHLDLTDHPIGQERRGNLWRLLHVFVLTGTFFVVEVAGAILTGSLALLADAGHMLSDLGAIALGLFAFGYSARPETPQKTYGFYRTEILAALANGVTLFGIVAYVVFEAVRRFQHPPEIQSLPMLGVALMGLTVNLFSMWLLHQERDKNLNLQGVFLHVLGDALSSLAAIAAALIMLLWGWYLADPLLSLLIAAIIAFSGWRLVRRTVDVLLEGTPEHIDLLRIKEGMLALPGIQSVHDLHIWTLTSGFVAMSGHVRLAAAMGSLSAQEVLVRLRGMLKGHGIHHVTVQLESQDLPDEEVHCVGDPRCLP